MNEKVMTKLPSGRIVPRYTDKDYTVNDMLADIIQECILGYVEWPEKKPKDPP